MGATTACLQGILTEGAYYDLLSMMPYYIIFEDVTEEIVVL